MSKTLFFKTNTLLKNLIGKDLINDDNIGIIELVKNSYDARSEKVEIIFDGFFSEGSSKKAKTNNTSSKIIIADNGSGMNEADIEDKWLNIAHSEKKALIDVSGAHYAGNKGVGRFSCDRLGTRLDMFTRKSGGDLLHLKINWIDFEQENKKDLTIQEIGVSLEQVNSEKAKSISGIKQPEYGTVLVISQLRSIWGKDELSRLKKELERFISPNQAFLNKSFEISLVADHFKKEDEKLTYYKAINGKIKNQIFEKLKFKTTYIESNISEDGKEISTVLFHDGDKVFTLLENNLSYPNLKNIKITLYFLNAYKKAYFTRQTGIRSIAFGSVFLFLNGFRVAPYGERGNDWLGLDVRKTQGTSRYFGTRDVVGRIELLDSENNFKPVSSREGLKNTPEFTLLKENYFKDVLRRIERFVVDGLDWDSVPKNDRINLDSDNGLDWDITSEKYNETWDIKKKRISTTIMTSIGLSKAKVKKFWFNTKLMDGLVEQKSKEVNDIISKIDNFDGDVIDNDLKENLKKISKIIQVKDTEIKTVKQELANLKVEAEESKEEIVELTNKAQKSQEVITVLETKTEQFETQTLFLKSISTLDTKTLLGYHHQICLDSSIIDNYVGRAVKALKNKGNINEALKYIEKISKANKKITATAQYATKANFKSGTKKEFTDLPTYFEQYLINVTSEFSGSGINLNIQNNITEAFEIKAKRIELSILIDNIVSNASKANASTILITMDKIAENLLQISFIDDGRGIDESVVEDTAFELGVTTTQGSGLGLYHAKEIMNSLSSEISLIPNNSKGAEIRMVFSR
ncbi:MAG: hypothetical protein COA95_07625 [Methylophaga sp.]|nr:MAG: hypothetical protein COA95_07625 [Methylophaga sp.]